MTEDSPPADNTRGLLRSMAVIASAQFLSILIRILKAKLVAVLLGPSGTGLLSVFANLQMLGSQAAGLGLAQSGVRDLATSRGDAEVLGRLRHVLMITLALQGGIAMAVIWLMREQISVWLLGDAVHVTEIGLVGVAVLLFLLASSQQTLLRGMRRVGDLGRVMVLGTLAGAVVGIAAVWLMGRDGLIWFLLAEPLGALLVGVIYARRLPLPAGGWPPLGEIWQRWQPMVRLGMVIMLGGLLTTATLLLVRSLIIRDLGLDAAGQFAAAWTIAMTYVGFLLQSMGSDYFPRLCQILKDSNAVNRLVNEQVQIALALGGPILLLIIGLAPWLIELMYSSDFDDAAVLLQWQMAGNIFRLTFFPMALFLLASKRPIAYFLIHLQFNIVFFGIIWLGLPVLGIKATGIGFLTSNLVHGALIFVIVWWVSEIRWDSVTFQFFLVHSTLALTLLVMASLNPLVGATSSIILGAATIIVGIRFLVSRGGPSGRIYSRLASFFKMIGWPILTINQTNDGKKHDQ